VVKLAAKLSSQYVSSILMAAPYFPPVFCESSEQAFAAAAPSADPTQNSPDFVELVLAEESPTSLPYIRMTVKLMADFGVFVIVLADNRYLIPRQAYVSPCSYVVEADASSASYPAAMAVVRGTCVELEGIGSSSTQGDAAFPLLL